jgi:thiamine biosynthesis lipoprotein
MQQLEFRAMGCQMLAIIDADENEAAEALAQVPVWFEDWENILSRFRANSELNRLNHNQGRAMPVSETFAQVLHHALEVANLTHGIVTPTILDALESAGYDASFELLNEKIARTQNSSTAVPDWHAIQFDLQQRRVQLPRGVRLDFGGTAKGWAADQAAQQLARIAPALVDAGGDIAISGARANGDRWHIAVADPFDADQDMERLVVRTGGVATSGRDYRKWHKNGVLQHHIIDPRTGLPAETDVLSATVIAPSARQAEVAAKVVLILGSTAGLRWLDEQTELAGLIILENGKVLYSARFEEYVFSDVFVAGNELPSLA